MMPSTAHIPDLTGRENRSLASQCIKTKKKFSVLRLLKNKQRKNTTQTKKINNKRKQQHLQQPRGSTVGSKPVAKGDLQFAKRHK